MYAPSTTSTTTSVPGLPMAAAPGDRRMRVVRLLRPKRSAPAFGFSFRGGYEHTTGFFVSKVEFNSEAQHQGLKVGDQVVSVNGFRVEDAVHTELAHYLASQSRLKIKVRNVGMIPVKEKSHEQLSWHFVSERTSLGSGASSSPTLCNDKELLPDVRVSILVPPRAKLGCGICKGPEWKPGIFVQFVREGGIAQDAGLRAGDQLVACNGYNFAHINFNEAIAVMKETGRLDLTVREGAGLDLISPESSGYNSSASSAAGERSPGPPAPLAPPAALRRRLASVAEEAADRVDRLNVHRTKRRTWDSIDYNWKNTDIHNFDVPSDIEPDYDCPSIPNNPHSYENQLNNLRKKEFVTSPSNRTIINLTEDGATIQCTYDNPTRKLNSFKANENEKTILVEVHHRETSAPPPVCDSQFKAPPIKKELMETTSTSSSISLSSAIAEEIQRRKLTKKPDSNAPQEPVKKPTIPKTIDNDKRKQHDALIDEFKKVHRKMFANQHADGNPEGVEAQPAEMDRQQTPLRNLEDPHTPSNGSNVADVTNGPLTNGHVANGHASGHTNGHLNNNTNGHLSNNSDVHLSNNSNVHLSNNTSGHISNNTNGHLSHNASGHISNNTSGQISNNTSGHISNNTSGHISNNTNGHLSHNTSGHLSHANGHYSNNTNGSHVNGHLSNNQNANTKLYRPAANGHVANGKLPNGHTITQQPKPVSNGHPPPPPPMPTTNGNDVDLKKIINHIQEKFKSDIINGSNTVQLRNTTLPRTPTPDYIGKTGTILSQSQIKEENAELQSIESYTLRNPSLSAQPRPPSNYFVGAPNGTATMKKNVRPVSVTIGEYNGSNAARRPPTKLDFLNGDSPDGHQATDNEPLTNRLQSELALTLSRSNLRKKTETMVDVGR